MQRIKVLSGMAFVVLLMFGSCKIPKFAHVAAVDPYLVTSDGQRVNATTVQKMNTKQFKSKIAADNQTYEMKNVLEYSDGSSIYRNLGGGKFGKKVVEGKINMFTPKLTPGGRPASQKPLNFFITIPGQNSYSRLSYPTLKSIIPVSSPAKRYLSRYRTINAVSYVLGSIGAGTTAAGIYQISRDKQGTPGIPSNPSGVLIAALGIWEFISAAVINEENKSNLFWAVKSYNTESDQ